MHITIYTDGSSLGNPGPGGFGCVLLAGPYRKEISEGYRLTTNNRMELMAVCVALEALKKESGYLFEEATKAPPYAAGTGTGNPPAAPTGSLADALR
ncbi:MAG: hypothetical protein II228_06870, partial [Alistipes sp.]|nr:hypothetical protein [Alistipes sp.]